MRKFSNYLRSLFNNSENEMRQNNQDLKQRIRERNSELQAYQYALDESAIVAITNQKGSITHVNDNFCKISGYSREELIGTDHRIINSGYHSKDFMHGLWHTIAGGKIWKDEIKNKDKNGSFYWVDTTIVPFLDKQKKPVKYLAICSDITEKKETENELKIMEEKIISKNQEVSEVLERINDGFLILDSEFRYKYANKKIGELTGHDPASLIGKNIWDVFPDAVGSSTYHLFTEAMKNRKPAFNLDFYKPLDLWQENYVYPVEDGISVFIRDVSAQKRSEQKLKESERIYKTIASNIPGSILCIIDKDYRYTLIKGDMLEKLGYNKDLLINNSLRDVIDVERQNFIIPHLQKAFAGEYSIVESVKNNIHIIYRFVPLKNEANEVYSVMIVGIDISELKNAQQLIEEANINLEKKVKVRTTQLEAANQELESFSYSIAHDLRTPLRAISGYANMLEEDYHAELDDSGKRFLKAITTNAKRMGTLIDDLLTFSRLGRKEMAITKIDMNNLLLTAIVELQLSEEIRSCITHDPLLPATGDFNLIKQVVINLISNAVKYSSKKPKTMIHISSLQKGDRVQYSVKDNGAGFDMSFAHKLFGVFQRLHSDEEFDGTGVGLAIVHRILKRHGGNVWADSLPDVGSTFYFTLPNKLISDEQY